MSKKQTKKPTADNREARYECTDWETPTVNVKKNGKGDFSRKCKTTGIAKVYLTPSQTDYLVKSLKRGCEVRINANDPQVGDFVRLFPVVATDGSRMFVASQAFGPLSDLVYGGKHVKLVRKGKEIDKKEYDEIRDEYRDERINVTPDTEVECPKCGHRFRVGKKLQ